MKPRKKRQKREREKEREKLVCWLKFLLLRKDIKGCYKFAKIKTEIKKKKRGKNLMDCEFQKEKKRETVQ